MPLVVVKAGASTELFPQHFDLFLKVFDQVLLVAVDPTRKTQEQQLYRVHGPDTGAVSLQAASVLFRSRSNQSQTRIFGRNGMVGHSLARENRHENHPGLRSLGAQPPKDGTRALGDSGAWVLSGVLGIARVLDADVEHNDPGMQPVQFAVVQAPKYVLDAVPAKTEIQRPVRPESGLPTGGAIGLRSLGITAPEAGDRVTAEHDFGIEPGFDGEKRWPLSSGNLASIGDGQ